MAYCPECGEEVRRNAAYCESCGASLESEEGTNEDQTSETKDIHQSAEGFKWKHAAVATGIGLIPSFGAYMLVSLGAYSAVVIAFLGAIPLFAYLMYRQPNKKAMASSTFFWLGIESFLVPLAAIFYTASYSAQETTTAAEQAGAAIGGGIVTIMAFVIGIPIGIVFYLLSRRLDPERS